MKLSVWIALDYSKNPSLRTPYAAVRTLATHFFKILILLGNTFVWLTLSMTELITSINQNEELPLLRNTVMKRLLSLAVVVLSSPFAS